jgi:hypothetical protein
MRSNPGAFLGLRLVLISSATSLGVANGILPRQSFELRTDNMPSQGYGWNLFSRCYANVFAFSKLLWAHLPSVFLMSGT